MFRKLWNDDAGVVSLEYLLLSVIVGLGMAVGTSAVSDALNAEYVELGQAILALDTSYSTNLQVSYGVFTLPVGHKAGTWTGDTPGFVGYAAFNIPASTFGTGIAGTTP